LFFTGFTDIGNKIVHDPQALFSLGAIAILALIGTVLANILFFRLIQRTNAIFASSVAYLIPVNAMIWGFIDGESLQWPHFAGVAFILLGIWVLRRR
jgi:drug/metabolite transporter (DMT)-like permease